MIVQGEVWWADLPEPQGSEAGFRRPVVVVQGDSLNRSRIATVVCVPLTTNLKWERAPGNVFLQSNASGLAEDSVANVSQILTVTKTSLSDRLRKIPSSTLRSILSGVDVVLGR